MSLFKIPSTSETSAEKPALLFRDLKRDADVKFLWGHQEKLLDVYYDQHLETKDLAVELPTGTGKTLVGLLIGEFRRRSRGERVVFLCSTKQLCAQVHRLSQKYGIRTSLLTGPQAAYDEADFYAYQQGNALAVSSYNGVFNTNPKIDDPHVIICDDAHAAESFISDMWTLRVKRDEQPVLFDRMFSLLKGVMTATSAYRVEAQDEKSEKIVELISPIALYDVRNQLADLVMGFLDEYPTLKYSWKLIGQHLSACNLYCSRDTVEIRPILPSGFDLALVQTVEESRRLLPAQNPYLRAKAKLMMSGIPVQCVLEDRWKGNDVVLASILGPIALQLYAKLGGIPWVLPASQSVDREIIIGIGNSIQRKNLYSGAEQSRIVGLTTFFSGEGRYLLGHQLPSVPYNEYFYALLEGLKGSIGHLAQEYGWKQDDNVRLVFHVFKPVRNIEVEVVEQLIKNYPQFRIKHAFVTVSRDHPFMMFRAASADRGELNVLLCERGENIVLDERSCLLQIRGPKHVKTKRHKFPTPVLIRMHENSSYHDLQYIAQQILDFSWASWRSFAPAGTPVSIFYSELIAKMTRELQQVPGWSPDILNSHFRSTKWFL